MNYQDAIAWLYSTQGEGIKLGLENIHRLLRELGLARASTPRSTVLHVAGTNGKGSVCAMLDAVCRAAGRRTGLFTSPHLVTFRERIRLDGAMISEEAVAEGLTRIRQLLAGWTDAHPTFFEITTALALGWFQRQEAEVVVLETGLGGRLDSTNAVTPAVSILTPISFDHPQYLGNTIPEIAAEKAGIIKPGIPVVSAPQSAEAARVFEETAARVGAPLQWIAKPFEGEVALAGSHQKWNAALALAGLRAANVPVSEGDIARGLKEVVWPGRFQRIAGPGGVPLILDGAHNEAAAARLVLTWREVCGEEKPLVVLGVLNDKDAAAICRELAPLASEFILTPVRSVRTCLGEALAGTVNEAAPGVPCRVMPSAGEALALAVAEAAGRRVLITGSLFLIGEMLGLLDGHRPEQSTQ